MSIYHPEKYFEIEFRRDTTGESSKSVPRKSVTYASNTLCYLCLRAGFSSAGRFEATPQAVAGILVTLRNCFVMLILLLHVGHKLLEL